MGRNLANLELLVIIASVFRRYEFVLEDPDAEVGFAVMGSNGMTGAVLTSMLQLVIREGFLRKPVDCKVGMKRRQL